jgi:hypothetical protein
VITAQIGPGAAAQVLGAGLRIFEARGFVDEILGEIIESGMLDSGGEAAPGGLHEGGGCGCAAPDGAEAFTDCAGHEAAHDGVGHEAAANGVKPEGGES